MGLRAWRGGQPLTLLVLLLVAGAVALCAWVQGAEARFIVVGNYTAGVGLLQQESDPWTNFWDYNDWAQQNPLYEGDILIFKYGSFVHVVWELPNQQAYDGCDYGKAVFSGNDTAGEGLGFWVVATKEPKYYACGIFSHCEYYQQKVIIQATLGPLPPNPIQAPCQLPGDPRGLIPPSPPNPPPRPPRPPPPPPLQGAIGAISRSAAASQYSEFFKLVYPIAGQLEQLAETTPITLLAPSNEAWAQYSAAIQIAVAIQPDDASKAYLLTRLLELHILTSFLSAQSLRSQKSPTGTRLAGETVSYDATTKKLQATGGSPLFGVASILAANLHTKVSGTPSTKIAVHGISDVLIPKDLTVLVDASARGKYTYGIDTPPALPPGADRKVVEEYLDTDFKSSNLQLFNDFGLTSITSSMYNNSYFDLWPYVASWGGVTLLYPLNRAWETPQPALVLAIINSLVPTEKSQSYLLLNILLYNSARIFYSSFVWQSATSKVRYQTLLFPTNVVFNYEGGRLYWYPDINMPSINTSNWEWPDIQSSADRTISLQGCDGVIFPPNITRLMPPSLVPQFGSEPQPSPPPPIASPMPSPPPAGALSVKCDVGGTWSGNGQTHQQYTCALVNSGTSGASAIELACSDEFSQSLVSVWNLNKDCSIPASLVAGQSWPFGFITTSQGPPNLDVLTSTTGGTLAVKRPGMSTGLALSCKSVGPGWTGSGGSFVNQYSCTLRNNGQVPVKAVKLKCTSFSPLLRWNLNSDCSLPVDSVPAGRSWTFGFQLSGSSSLAISSFKKGSSEAA